MNQFDEFFEKKLNDEQQFAGQKRSWSQLNRDLHVFEKGTSIASKTVAVWKVVGVVAVLISAALIWEHQQLLRENKKLKMAVKDFEMKQAAKNTVQQEQLATIPPAQNKLDNQPDQLEKTENTPSSSSNNTITAKPETVSPSFKSEKSDKIVTVPSKGIKSPVEPANNSGSASSISTNSASTQPEDGLKKSDNPEESVTALPHPTQPLTEANQTKPEPADSLKTTNDSTAVAQKPAPTIVDSTAKKPLEKAPPIEEKPIVDAPVPVIDPVHENGRRWSAGVRVVSGFSQPKEKGVSHMMGQGIAVAYRFWNNFSITTSADFLKFKVNADSIPCHFTDIDLPPGGPGHHYSELKKVESDQVMQQYTVGLSYAQKLVGRWRTSLSVGHTWAYLPSRLMSLKFEEMPPPPPHGPWHPEDEYLTIHTEENWISDIWRLGVGFQYETPRWIFGVKGDYSKRMNKVDPSFDAIFASADVLYKF